MLHLEDFLNIISSNSQDYERFCEIKDKINLYQNAEDLYIKCPSCSHEDHGVLCCPLIHLNFDKKRIIARYTFSKDQERGEKRKRRKIKMYAIKNFKNNSSAAILINRYLQEKEKQTKEKEDHSENDEECKSSSFEEDMRFFKRPSLCIIGDNSNSNFVANNDNLTLKPKKTVNTTNSTVSEMFRRETLMNIMNMDDGLEGGGGGGGGGGGEGGGTGEGENRTNENKHSNSIPINLMTTLERLLSSVPLVRARKNPGLTIMSSGDPLFTLNEISRNYGHYFPHNNIASVVNFIKKFYDNQVKRKERSFLSSKDLIGGERKIVRGEKRMVKEGKKMEAVKRSEDGGRKSEEEENMGRKRSFFSSFFDREREIMRHKGSVDRERIVAILRKLERKRKGYLEKLCCLLRYFWK